jgi:hypothetical protein
MFILMVLWWEYGSYVYFDGFMMRIWCICLFWWFYDENMVHMFILTVLWWEYGAYVYFDSFTMRIWCICLFWWFYDENMVHIYFDSFMMRIWCICLFWRFYDENMVHMFILMVLWGEYGAYVYFYAPYSHRKTVKINICTIFSS